MTAKLENHIAKLGLQPTEDPSNQKLVYRRESFEQVAAFDVLDMKIGAALSRCRQDKGLSRAELAKLVGLSEQVYGRYERNTSKMHVSRLIHLCEVLGVSPLTLLFGAAPHLFGGSADEADTRFRMITLLDELPPETLSSIVSLLESVAVLNKKRDREDAPSSR
jgi:transcriptional regulator with XRE-family HTH domain